jgi:two-component system invasion response regulator UvrY
VTHVLLIDDHPIVLQGCKKLLESAGADDFDQAQSASAAFRLYRRRKPDVIVLDLAMQAGTLNGLSFVRRFRRIDTVTPVLVLTMHRDPVVVSRALELGANGYVLKDAPPEEFVLAFENVRYGRPYLSQELASDVVFNRIRNKNNKLDRLTPRELQTLALVAEGKPFGEIAEELQDGGQYLHAVEGQARSAQTPRADAHRPPIFTGVGKAGCDQRSPARDTRGILAARASRVLSSPSCLKGRRGDRRRPVFLP